MCHVTPDRASNVSYVIPMCTYDFTPKIECTDFFSFFALRQYCWLKKCQYLLPLQLNCTDWNSVSKSNRLGLIALTKTVSVPLTA